MGARFVLSEVNLISVLQKHEVDVSNVFERVEDAIASLTDASPWRLHERLVEYGVDPVMRRAWDRRNAKRRVLRKHAKKTNQLPIDAWQQVINQAPPMQVLMLSMTCKAMHAVIRDDHQLWRKFLSRWERARMNRLFPNFIASHVKPPGFPLAGWEWGEIADKSQFNSIARKVIALQHMPCCGMCGQTRRKTDPVWALGMRVCSNCWRGNLISNLVLLGKYGIKLTEPLKKGSAPHFISQCMGKVLFFFHRGTDSSRKRFTYNAMDFETMPATEAAIVFFWEPHIRQIIDLDATYRQKKNREAAATILHALIRRNGVMQTIQKTFNRGLSNGFTQMTSGAKTAVLYNAQNLFLIQTRKQTICRRQVVFLEPLFFDYRPEIVALKHAAERACGRLDV